MVDRKTGRGSPGDKGVRAGDTRTTLAATVQDFAANPLKRLICGPCFVYAWPTPTLCVTVLWGAPRRDDLERLLSLYRLELGPPAQPHDSIIDTTRIETVHEDAFAAFFDYVREQRSAMLGKVQSLTLVRNSGLVGAVAAGFYETIDAPYEVRAVDRLRDALAACAAPAWVEADLLERVGQSAELPDALREVRQAIEATLGEVTVEEVARVVGVSVRTLQRRLKSHQTTFQKEHAIVQVEVAKKRLATSDTPISEIAYDVGAGTPQHLSALFRRHLGMTPSEYRRSQETG